jgi:hypothetical protein
LNPVPQSRRVSVTSGDWAKAAAAEKALTAAPSMSSFPSIAFPSTEWNADVACATARGSIQWKKKNRHGWGGSLPLLCRRSGELHGAPA